MVRFLAGMSYDTQCYHTLTIDSSVVPLSGGLSFRCSRQQGAVLAMPNEALSQDALNRRIYRNYMIENCERWLAFSEQRGLDLRIEDIVLVTGCDLTATWTVAAFTNSECDTSIQLQMGSGFPCFVFRDQCLLEKRAECRMELGPSRDLRG